MDNVVSLRREGCQSMKKKLLIMLVVIAVAAIVFCVVITRDGELVIPQGKGIITLDDSEFEAFPLPDYAAKHVTEGYKSYFVEVEPGIKVHVLEVGSGFPVFLLHGNPTSGFLYRIGVVFHAHFAPDALAELFVQRLIGDAFGNAVNDEGIDRVVLELLVTGSLPLHRPQHIDPGFIPVFDIGNNADRTGRRPAIPDLVGIGPGVLFGLVVLGPVESSGHIEGLLDLDRVPNRAFQLREIMADR